MNLQCYRQVLLCHNIEHVCMSKNVKCQSSVCFFPSSKRVCSVRHQQMPSYAGRLVVCSDDVNKDDSSRTFKGSYRMTGEKMNARRATTLEAGSSPFWRPDEPYFFALRPIAPCYRPYLFIDLLLLLSSVPVDRSLASACHILSSSLISPS